MFQANPNTIRFWRDRIAVGFVFAGSLVAGAILALCGAA